MKAILTLITAAVLFSPAVFAGLKDVVRETFPPPERAFTFSAPVYQQCCKICTKGKACGDTCIPRNRTCNVGQGCACDG